MITTPQAPCTPRSRCYRWRTCQTCGAIRQARIADFAEELQRHVKTLHFVVMHPPTPDPASAAELARAMHKADPHATFLWTIEQNDAGTAHHANMISTREAPSMLLPLQTWQQTITGNVRDVAAYISKPDHAPSKDIYAGRVFGRYGPLWRFITTADQQAVLQAAAMQKQINDTIGRPPTRIWNVEKPPRDELSWDEHKALAAKYLPDIYDLRQSLKNANGR